MVELRFHSWQSWLLEAGGGPKDRGDREKMGRARQRPLTWVSMLRKFRPLWLTARMQGAGTVTLLQLWMKKKEEPNIGKALSRPAVGKVGITMIGQACA